MGHMSAAHLKNKIPPSGVGILITNIFIYIYIYETPYTAIWHLHINITTSYKNMIIFYIYIYMECIYMSSIEATFNWGKLGNNEQIQNTVASNKYRYLTTCNAFLILTQYQLQTTVNKYSIKNIQYNRLISKWNDLQRPIINGLGYRFSVRIWWLFTGISTWMVPIHRVINNIECNFQKLITIGVSVEKCQSITATIARPMRDDVIL